MRHFPDWMLIWMLAGAANAAPIASETVNYADGTVLSNGVANGGFEVCVIQRHGLCQLKDSRTKENLCLHLSFH
jgi:hypothetical protein